MAKPWERYQQQPEGPWAKYQGKAEQPQEQPQVAPTQEAPESEGGLMRLIPGAKLYWDVGSTLWDAAVNDGSLKGIEQYAPPVIAGEALATLGTGLAGEVGGGLKGAYEAATGGADAGAQAVQQAREGAYTPRAAGTQTSMQNLQYLGRALEYLEQMSGTGAEKLATSLGAEPGSPSAATAYAAGATLPAAVGTLLPGSRAVRPTQQVPRLGADVPPGMAVEDIATSVRNATGWNPLESGKRQRATQDLAQQAQVQPELVRAAEGLGIRAEDVPPEVLSGNQAFREVAGVARSVPGSTLNARYETFLKDLARRTDDLAKQAGAEDISTVNIRVADELTKNIEQARNVERDLYQAIEGATDKPGLISPRQPVDLSPIVGQLNQRLRDVGGDPTDLTKMERKLLTRLAEKQVDEAGNITYAARPKTWTALTDLRKEMNAARSGKGIFGDAASYELDSYASLISDTQKGVADALGYGDQFRAALEATGVKKRAQEAAQELLGRKLENSFSAKLDTKMSGLAKGRSAEFENVINSMPQELRQEALTSFVYSKMFNPKQAEASLNKGFGSWYNSLNANPAAKEALFKNLPSAVRRDVDNIGRLVSAIQRADAEKIQTGRLLAADENLLRGQNAIGKVAQFLGTAARGYFGGGTGMVADAVATGAKTSARLQNAASDLLGSPTFQRHLLQVIDETDPSRIRAADLALAKSPDWRRFFVGLSEPERAKIRSTGITLWLMSDRDSALEGKGQHGNEGHRN